MNEAWAKRTLAAGYAVGFVQMRGDPPVRPVSLTKAGLRALKVGLLGRFAGPIYIPKSWGKLA